MILKVIAVKAESKDSLSIIFKKPAGFNFYPGQYIDVELPVADNRGKVRPFTLSSSPTENFLMITIKVGISNFKKRLQHLQNQDTINISHPAGTFIVDETEKAYLLAGGIGITPFRSMIKYAIDQRLTIPIMLVYSNSDDKFIFKKELDKWQKIYPRLKIIYINTSIEGRLNQEKFLTIVNSPLPIVNCIYYLSGPPAMVDNFLNIILSLGVDEVSIRTDRFEGY